MNRGYLIPALAAGFIGVGSLMESVIAQTASTSSTSASAKAVTTKKPAAPSCANPDTAAAWYKKQRVTLSEAGLTWTDDSLRVALLGAAGLTVDAALAPQLGWQNVEVKASVSPAESTMVAALKRRGGRGRGGGRGAVAPGATPGAPSAAATSGATVVAGGRAGTSTDSGRAGTGPGGAAGPSRGVGGGQGAAGPWPLKSAVGVAGIRAVYVLLQTDSALQESGKHHMMEAGPDEALAADVAVLEDRSRLIVGRKQIYGTQLHAVRGTLVPLPIEDSAHVDLRRGDAGLPPLKWALCNANSKP